MALSFSYQGYYDFIDDYKAKNACNIIMTGFDLQNTSWIQDESWVSSVIAYFDKTTEGGDDAYETIDIKDWNTDTKIGEAVLDWGQDEISFTINGTSYNYDSNELGFDIYTDGNDNYLYTLDRKFENSNKEYLFPCGFTEGLTPYYYNMLTENTDNHNFVIVFSDGGYIHQTLLSILDLTDDIEYYDPENDMEGTARREIEWNYDEPYSFIYLYTGCKIFSNDLSNICCAIPAIDEFGEDGVLGLVDTEHFCIKNNGKEPVIKKPINIYRSFWNKYCEGEYVEIYGFRQEGESYYITLPMLLINKAGDDGSKCCIYVDSTANWVEYFEQDNLYESWISENLESVPVDEYYEINIIDDPVGGEMMTRINMENRDRKLPKGGFA